MWKEILICIAIITIIVVGNVITQNYTLESVNELTKNLEELKGQISEIEKEKKDSNEAKMKMNEIKKDWDLRHEKMAYYIEHDELEKIETNLIAMNSYIETEEYSQAIGELDKNIFVLEHIKEKYEFNLENVF